MKFNKIRKTMENKYFRIGGYSAVVCAAVILAAVILNLLVNMLPSSISKPDISDNHLYEITEQTETIIKSITDTVVLYQIAETGTEDQITRELITRYCALNGKLSVESVDPALRPTFTAQYTDEEVEPNSVIAVNTVNGRSRYVPYSDIYATSYSDEELQNYYYYGITPTGTTSFAGENALTSAIDYVSAKVLPSVYVTTGHGEAQISADLLDSIDSDNINVADLALLTTEIPADANCVIINQPTLDLDDSELTRLRAFIAGGGSVIAVTDYEVASLPKLIAFMAEYGMIGQPGLVVESASANYYSAQNGSYPYYLLPNIKSTAISQKLASSNVYVIMPLAHGITVAEEPASTLTVTPLFTTTAAAYIKTNVSTGSSITKEDGDLTTQFSIGCMTEVADAGRVIWFSSGAITDGSGGASFANNDYLLATVSYVCDKETSVAIATKSMQVTALVVSELASSIWGVILVGIIPAAFLVTGFVVWNRRRTR